MRMFAVSDHFEGWIEEGGAQARKGLAGKQLAAAGSSTTLVWDLQPFRAETSWDLSPAIPAVLSPEVPASSQRLLTESTPAALGQHTDTWLVVQK